MKTIDIESNPRSDWLDVALAIVHESFDEASMHYTAYKAAYGAADALTVQKSREMSDLFELVMKLEIERSKVFDESVKQSIVWD